MVKDTSGMVKKELKAAGVIRSADKPDYALRVTGDMRGIGEKLAAHGWKQTGRKSFKKGFMKAKFVSLKGLAISKMRRKSGAGKKAYFINISVDPGAYSPLSGLESRLPACADIKKLPPARLEQISREAIATLKQSGRRLYSFSDIRRYTKLSCLLAARNMMALRAARKSRIWKAAIEKLRGSEVSCWSSKSARMERAKLDISYADAERAFLHVLKQYEDCTWGYWTMIEISQGGAVRRVGLFDNVDEDQHKRIFHNLLMGPAKRGGAVPLIPAAILRTGTVLTGNDGKKYMVAAAGHSRRWVIAGR